MSQANTTTAQSITAKESDAATLAAEIENLTSHLKEACTLPRQLDITLAKLDNIDRSGMSSKRKKSEDNEALGYYAPVQGIAQVNEKNPVSFDAMFAAEALRRVLTQHAGDARLGMRIAAPTADDTTSLALYLLGEDVITWMSVQESWRHTYNSLVRTIADAVRAIDRPEPTYSWVDPEAPVDEKPVQTAERLVANIPEEIMNEYAQTADIVVALKASELTAITAKRIRDWAKDNKTKLVPIMRTVIRTRYNGYTVSQSIETMPTYRIGDVAALWLAAEHRKAAKAARDAARASQADMAVAA